MLNYNKLSKSARARTAILLLLVYMGLAMADLFISFFGGLVVGVLLMQFEMEAHKFFKRSFAKLPAKTGLLKRYSSLSNKYKIFLKAGLQVVVTILILAGLLDTFWGGIISGILLTMLVDDTIRHQRKRSKQKASPKKTTI